MKQKSQFFYINTLYIQNALYTFIVMKESVVL